MKRAALFLSLSATAAGCSPDFLAAKLAGLMVNLMGLASVAGAAPHDQFTKSERDAEGFSVHADADEHSRMLFLTPDLVGKDVRQAQAVVAHEPADLVTLARKPGWPGYFGTPAIANADAGRRKMDGLAAAAVGSDSTAASWCFCRSTAMYGSTPTRSRRARHRRSRA